MIGVLLAPSSELMLNIPPERVFAPVKVFVPVRIRVPVPVLVRLPAPESEPAYVVLALFPPTVRATAAGLAALFCSAMS